MSVSTLKKQRSLAGSAEGAGLWGLQAYDIDRLRHELALVTKDWDWERGCFGHSLPLTTSKLSEFGATHYNNLITSADGEQKLEAPDILDDCPYFLEIFNGFQCEKSSFRILRRPPHTSYTLHRDTDLGMETFRVQIPIESNSDVRLLVSTIDNGDDFILSGVDYRKLEDWEAEGIDSEDVKSWFEEFVRLNANKVRIYETPPGQLYYFHTPLKYHNLMNFGDEDRYTIAIDLVANEWLYKQYPVFLKR